MVWSRNLELGIIVFGFLLQHGFICSTADSSLFIYSKGSALIYLLVYVDDIIVTCTKLSDLDSLISKLHGPFVMKNLGRLHYFLGIEAHFTDGSLFLSQSKASLLDATPVETPIVPKSLFLNPWWWAATRCYSIPDPCWCASICYHHPSRHPFCCEQFMHQPTVSHWQAIKRILHYLKGSLTQGLRFSLSMLGLICFFWCRLGWWPRWSAMQSTRNVCVYIGSNLLTWIAKKQPTITRSSTEAEYRSLVLASVKISWLQQLLTDLGISLSSLRVLYCDNQSALSLASNPVFHARIKHIEIDCHFVQEKVVNKELTIQFVTSEEQVINIFTKVLCSPRFLQQRSKLQLCDLVLSLKGHIGKLLPNMTLSFILITCILVIIFGSFICSPFISTYCTLCIMFTWMNLKPQDKLYTLTFSTHVSTNANNKVTITWRKRKINTKE